MDDESPDYACLECGDTGEVYEPGYERGGKLLEPPSGPYPCTACGKAEVSS